MAEALLKKFRPEIDVDSAGVDPAIPISEAAKKYLARESARKYLKHAPEGLNGKKLNSYDRIIVMKPKHRDIIRDACPECEDRIVVWNIDDPYFLPHGCTEKIFNQIKDKVMELAGSF